MAEVALALHAMATRFELVMYGDNPVALRAAGEEALAEIERLENVLSLYRPQSEIAHVNALAAHRPVRVSPPVFALLSQARKLWEETGGAFDITVAPLVRCWGFMGGQGRLPSEQEIRSAGELVGMSLVDLQPAEWTVSFRRPGVMIDLGAIGKGYAIDCAVGFLREAGVTSALIHGGTSSSYALGTPPGRPGWTFLLDPPGSSDHHPSADSRLVSLKDASLSLSGIWGRAFDHQGETLGHVIDPRTGRPVAGHLMSAVVLPTATETDALSTALLVGGQSEFERFKRARPEGGALLALKEGGQLSIHTHNLPPPGQGAAGGVESSSRK